MKVKTQCVKTPELNSILYDCLLVRRQSFYLQQPLTAQEGLFFMIERSPEFTLLNERDAADILGFSVKTLQRRRRLRETPQFLKMGRKVRYRLSDLQQYIEESAVKPRVASIQ